MEILRSYFNEIIDVSQQDFQNIMALTQVQEIKKEEVFLKEGERASQEIFVAKGVVRAFIVDEEGNEKSTAFFQAPAFISMTTLRSKKGLSSCNYQALCNATILAFQSKSLYALLSASQQLNILGKVVKEKEMARLSDRDGCLLQVKAKDKYLKFLACYPNIEGVIAQRHIASYLGITPVSLSRLKKELAVAAGVIN